ncbi:MAG: hypothetical protein IH891_04750 [Planctomycetes bacterium]|nr:hypothetical protein [Planctomycetota bacterium]
MRLFITTFVLLALLTLPGCGLKIARVHTPVAAKKVPPGNAYGLKKHNHIEYDYYPSAEVYFDPQRKLYFWHAAAYWGVGKRLPSTYKLDHTERRLVPLDTKLPYRRHDRVRSENPKKKSGRKHKKAYANVNDARK